MASKPGSVVGRLTTRTGRYRIYPVAGTLLATGGLWLLSTMEPDASRLVSSARMVVVGAGIGATPSVLTIAVPNTAESRDLAPSTAPVNFLRTFGSTIGVAVFGAILTRPLRRRHQRDGRDRPAPRCRRRHPHPEPACSGSLGKPLGTIAVGGLSGAITFVFVEAGVMAVGAVVAVAIREMPLRDTAASATTEPTAAPEPA
ncbi:MAG: hypothetical protein AB7V43_03915 [Acidimicrobiia bacterium]